MKKQGIKVGEIYKIILLLKVKVTLSFCIVLLLHMSTSNHKIITYKCITYIILRLLNVSDIHPCVTYHTYIHTHTLVENKHFICFGVFEIFWMICLLVSVEFTLSSSPELDGPPWPYSPVRGWCWLLMDHVSQNGLGFLSIVCGFKSHMLGFPSKSDVQIEFNGRSKKWSDTHLTTLNLYEIKFYNK